MRFIPLFFLIFLTGQLAKTEPDIEEKKFSFGLFGNYSYNMHIADFRKIPDCPSCSPGYKDGYGAGFALGALFEKPLSNVISIGARIGYYDISGKLKSREGTTIIVNSAPSYGEFEHRIDANLSSIGLEPAIRINPIPNISFNIGFHYGYLAEKSYSQIESIVKPDGYGTFVDQSGNDSRKRTRNEFSGTLEKASSTLFSPFIGLSYQLPMNKNGTITIEPEFYFFLGAVDFVSAELVKLWKGNSFRAGLALKYNIISKPRKLEYHERFYLIDTIAISSEIIAETRYSKGIERIWSETDESAEVIHTKEYSARTDTLYIAIIPSFDINLTLKTISQNGASEPVNKVRIEEFISSRLQPLLNYIFFEEGSSELPVRYNRLSAEQAGKFSENSLFHENTIETYHQILNIIGERLTRNVRANLTITGCNDGFSSEKNANELSKQRAEAIKDYLVDIWNIAPTRLIVRNRNLPANPSIPISEPDKTQENRRVELTSDNSEILAPLYMNDTLRSVTPSKIRLEIASESANMFTNSELTLIYPPEQLFKINLIQKNTIKSGQTNFFFFEAELDELLNQNIRKSSEMECYITLRDTAKEINSARTILPVEFISLKSKKEEQKADKRIDTYSLILFDFDNADISLSNSRIIKFVRDRISADSKVTITGYTDRTGDADYNRLLSERRAKGVQNQLEHKNSVSLGIGEDDLIHDNDLPEGRFYCRTVNIFAVTEIINEK